MLEEVLQRVAVLGLNPDHPLESNPQCPRYCGRFIEVANFELLSGRIVGGYIELKPKP